LEVDGDLRQLQPTEQKAEPAEDQQQVSWLDNVELVPVAATGPGHRACNPGATQQVLAVVPQRDFAAGELIGFYLGKQIEPVKKTAATMELVMSWRAPRQSSIMSCQVELATTQPMGPFTT
jgi:hypothetical protein